MYLIRKFYLHTGVMFLVLLLSSCGQSLEVVSALDAGVDAGVDAEVDAEVSPNAVNDQPRQTITLRAASALIENSIAFSSYEGAMVDIVVNGGEVQSFSNRGTDDWTLEIEGVNLGQENSIEVEWYIQQGTERYIIATQSGLFTADSALGSATLDAPYESDAFDHDNDTVSNLIEVNAGGFPVAADEIPEVIDVVAPGTFVIGSQLDEPGSLAYENEMAATTAIANNYSIGKYEVTYAQFQKYIESTGAHDLPDDNDWGGGDLPVTNVSWSESYAYTAWLSKITGETYRLPTEAEWEYAARGNTTTNYVTGQTISSHNANFNTTVLDAVYLRSPGAAGLSPITGVLRDEGLGVWNEYSFDAATNQQQLAFEFEEVRRDTTGILILDSSRDISLVISQANSQVYLVDSNTGELGLLYNIAERSPPIAEFIGQRPVAVGSFSPNAFGLYDMHGNVWEFTCSELQLSYFGAEQVCVDPELADTPDYTMAKRGGSWNLAAREVRSANRGWNNQSGQRQFNTGFRVVKEL